MKKTLLAACMATALIPLSSHAQIPGFDDLKERLDSLGDPRIDMKGFSMSAEGNTIIKGPLHIRSDEMEVFANSAEYIQASEQLRFMGDVAIYRDGLIYRGEKATYNTNSGQLDATDMRSAVEPLFFKAGSLSTSTSEISVIETTDAVFTTEDSQDPDFHLESEKVSIYPEERVVFHKVKAFVGDTPVFYFPYLSQPLDSDLGYTFTPGYRSNLGAFLMNQYGVPIGDSSIVKYKFDLYSARGVGAGFDLESRKYARDENFGKFKFYWVYDGSPQENNTFSRISRENVESSRYRVNLQHRIYLPGPEESDFFVDVDINKISDEFFYEDFSPWEFREDPQPDNFINLVKRSERAELSVITRFQANDWAQADQRLPEIALDNVRQTVFNTGLFYSGTSSFGFLEERSGVDDALRVRDRIADLEGKLADPEVLANLSELETQASVEQLRASLVEPEFTRSFSFHQFYYPVENGNSFVVTPRLGAGYSSYSSITGPQPNTDSRFILAAGLEASFKMSKTYDDIVNPSMGLDGLKHVIQPYLNWSFVSADPLGDQFRGIDRYVASTRPRPLDMSNFTAIDSLRDWNIIRAGIYNRLQTKRNNATYNWLTSNTYIDTFVDDPEFARSRSNLYQDFEWRPLPWAKLNLTAQIPTGGELSFTEVNTRATFMPTDYLDLIVGHRLLADHPYFQDSNLVDFGAYARLSENWGVSLYERYELDDSTLELQQYSVHRDLNSWIASFGATVRDNRGQADWGLLFSLTLKDFPSVRVPLDFDPQGGRR